VVSAPKFVCFESTVGVVEGRGRSDRCRGRLAAWSAGVAGEEDRLRSVLAGAVPDDLSDAASGPGLAPRGSFSDVVPAARIAVGGRAQIRRTEWQRRSSDENTREGSSLALAGHGRDRAETLSSDRHSDAPPAYGAAHLGSARASDKGPTEVLQTHAQGPWAAPAIEPTAGPQVNENTDPTTSLRPRPGRGSSVPHPVVAVPARASTPTASRALRRSSRNLLPAGSSERSAAERGARRLGLSTGAALYGTGRLVVAAASAMRRPSRS